MVNIILIGISIVVFGIRMYTNRQITIIAKVLVSLLVSVITTLITFILFYVFLESLLIFFLVGLLVGGYTLLRISNIDDYRWLNELTNMIFDQVYESLVYVIGIIMSIHIVLYFFEYYALTQQILLSIVIFSVIVIIRFFIENKVIYRDKIVKVYMYSLILVVVIFVYGFISGKLKDNIDLIQSEDFYSIEKTLQTSELANIDLSTVFNTTSEYLGLNVEEYVVTNDYIFIEFSVNENIMGSRYQLVRFDRETKETILCDYSFAQWNTTIVDYDGIGFFLNREGLTSVEKGNEKTHFDYTGEDSQPNRYTLLYVKDEVLTYEDSFGVYQYNLFNAFVRVSEANEYDSSGWINTVNLQLVERYLEDGRWTARINGEDLIYDSYIYLREGIIVHGSFNYLIDGKEFTSPEFYGAYKDNDKYYLFDHINARGNMEVTVLNGDKDYVETWIDPIKRNDYEAYKKGFTLSILELVFAEDEHYLMIYQIEEPETTLMFLGRETYKIGFVVLAIFAVAPVKVRMRFKNRFLR